MLIRTLRIVCAAFLTVVFLGGSAAWATTDGARPQSASEFLLAFADDRASIPLKSFKGCADHPFGYSDCRFEIRGIAGPTVDWFMDTVRGDEVHRDLTVFRVGPSGRVISRTVVEKAFLSDVRLSDLAKYGARSAGTMQFTAVPGRLETLLGGAPVPGGAFALRRDRFDASIDGIDDSEIVSLRGLHMTVPKVQIADSGSWPHRYIPGSPAFDDVLIEAISPPGGGYALATWQAHAIEGVDDARNGTVTLYGGGDEAIASVALIGLRPQTFFTSQLGRNGIRSNITAGLARFELGFL